MQSSSILKKVFVACVSFLVPFLIFVFLSSNELSKVLFYSPPLYLIVTVITSVLSFIIFYLAYQIYIRDRDARMFAAALAFCIFGLVFFSDIISTSNLFNKEVFEIIEHYGMLVGAMSLLVLAAPANSLNTLNAAIYHRRRETFLSVILCLLIFFGASFLFPSIVKILGSFTPFAMVSTGVLFFTGLSMLLIRGEDEENSPSPYFIASFSILINTAIIPFFYEHWSILWWYFNFVIFASLIIFFVGLVRGVSKTTGSPIYAKIGTKIILFILFISIFPLVATNYFIFNNSKVNLQKQVFEDLDFVSAFVEGQVLSYFNSVEIRTIDFSSDGFIRDKLKEIVRKNSTRAVDELNTHLIKNKQSLDETISQILILGPSGKIVSSTNKNEIGKDESNDKYFLMGKKSVYTSELDLYNNHSNVNERLLAVAAPLTDKETGESIGVIVNFFKMDKIKNILTYNVKNIGDNLFQDAQIASPEIYVVDNEGIMFIHPSTITEDSANIIVNTLPVQKCLKEDKSIIDTYNNYRDVEVIGSSICLRNHGWIVLIEKVKSDVFQPLTALEDNLTTIVPITVLMIILAGLYFSSRMTKPIESLAIVSKKIADGDLAARSDIKSRDEIGIFAQNFNSMADRLIEARNFPQNIIRSMKDVLMVLAPDATIKEVNEATLNLLGYENNDLVGKQIEEIIKKEKSESIFAGANLKKLLEKGFAKDIEVSYVTKVGESIPFSMTVSAIKNDNGGVIGIVVVAKDMRIFKEVEREKSEFVSVAAHQLRTPLSAIKWTIRMILDGDFGSINEEQRKALEDGDTSSDRMITLISDLLNVSRIEEGKFGLNTSLADISKMLTEIVAGLKIKAIKRKVELKITLFNEIPMLKVDTESFSMAIENLIDNSIKYTPENGKVEIEIERVQDYVEIRIKDNGIGIDNAEQPKIFSRFFRSKNAKLRETDGSGLGLYIAKHIIEGHNGKIWFVSPAIADKGTIFYVRMPIYG